MPLPVSADTINTSLNFSQPIFCLHCWFNFLSGSLFILQLRLPSEMCTLSSSSLKHVNVRANAKRRILGNGTSICKNNSVKYVLDILKKTF